MSRSAHKIVCIPLIALIASTAGCLAEMDEPDDDKIGSNEQQSGGGRGDGHEDSISSTAGTSIAAAQPQSMKAGSEGPFHLERFANRIATTRGDERPAPIDSLAAAATAAPLVFDDAGGSNELILRLDYGRLGRLRALLPAVAAGRSQSAVDQEFFSAVATRQRSIGLAFGQPVHARYLIEHGRLGFDSTASRSSSRAMAEVEKYIVVRYPSLPLARAAWEKLKSEQGVASVSMNAKGLYSWYPDDLYFQSYAVWGPGPQAMPGTQWGMKVMNFEGAWDKSQGFAHVGVLDGGYPGEIVKDDPNAPTSAAQNLNITAPHDDIKANYRHHFNPFPYWWAPDNDGKSIGWHATHVTGIIAAQANNGIGVAGGCPTCSVSNFFRRDNATTITAIMSAIDAGMQVLNLSGEFHGDPEHTAYNCTTQPALCLSVQALKDRDILLVQAAGNFRKQYPAFPSNLPPASTTILAVGGTEVAQPTLSGGQPTSGSLWFFNAGNGSTWPGKDGVVAPAKSIVSTAPRYSPAYDAIPADYAMCGDYNKDESRARFPGGMSETYTNEGVGDGFGSCTGTSMAAPHVAALAGLIRSIDPLMSAAAVRAIIQNSGNLSNQRTEMLGYGLPNALTATNAAIAANPTRLTPLFSFYSSDRSDSFYTTIPQMAAAALIGTLMPRVVCSAGMSSCVAQPAYSSAYGVTVTGHGASGGAYTSFPGIAAGGSLDSTPKAEAWVFTTHENPKDPSIPLVPLYRLSWKCGDSTWWICSTKNSHTDTVYTADPAGVQAFMDAQYKLDGIEGYIYPKSMPQPPGTVRLMRKYNAARDDHAIFPETNLSAMTALGYTENSGSDWLGYVYPNNGPVPTIQ